MTDFDGKAIWTGALDAAKAQVPEQEFLMWFRLVYKDFENGILKVLAPNSFLKDQFLRKYHPFMVKILRDLTATELNLAVEAEASSSSKNSEQSGKKDPSFAQSAKSVFPSTTDVASRETPSHNPYGEVPMNHQQDENKYNTPRRNDSLRSEDRISSSLLSGYRFENYVIGENNRFAVNAAEAVSQYPGKKYNPFLIYGGVGLGKTHLMHSIGNRIIETNPYAKVLCLSAEEFTNEFIRTLHEKSTQSFKNKYRNVDVLLIDDIHFFQNKLGVQEELFHTFNALYDAERQMIFTCDRPASELKNFSDRLKSRFERGLNSDLQPPDYETRIAILQSKVHELKVVVPNEVLELISKNVATNVRDLEACLTKLVAFSELVHKDLSVEISRNLLKDMFIKSRHDSINVDSIIRTVSDQYKLSLSDLKGKKRNKNIAMARQISMYIIREITEYSTTEIGTEFGGRDHTTVMHSCQKIEDLVKFDSNFSAIVQKLIRESKENASK
jgi:chromosomal replication initiator protein